MYFVSGHYRQPLAFSAERVAESGRSVERLRELCRRLDPSAPEPESLKVYAHRFRDALADDFDTPAARAALFDWAREANRRLDAGERVGVGRLREMLWTLGFEALLEERAPAALDDHVAHLLCAREEARAARDFATADARRDELAALGWEVRDTPEGPRLERASR